MKRLFILLFFIFFSPGVFSQEFTGGILFGFVSSQLDGDRHAGYHKASINFGGYVNRNISPQLSGQMELKFIQKGSYSSGKDMNDPDYYKSQLNYIEIPVLLNYMYGKFLFEAGLSAGYLFNAKEDKDGYGLMPAEPPYSTPFKKYEFCGIAGFNYQVLQRLKVNFRFEYSILPVRYNPGSLYFNGNQFNNVLTFSVYYQF